MRSIIVPLIFAVCSLLSTAIYASEGGSDTKVPDKTIVLYDNIPSGRPNAPSRVYIECTYGSGFINFSFPESIQEISVEIYNEDESICGVVTNNFPCMELPDMSGNYNIVCTTENNKIYRGILTF